MKLSGIFVGIHELATHLATHHSLAEKCSQTVSCNPGGIRSQAELVQGSALNKAVDGRA